MTRPTLLSLVDVLGEAVTDAETIGQAVADAADQDNPPAWIHVYRTQLARIREAADALECVIRQSPPGAGAAGGAVTRGQVRQLHRPGAKSP